MATKSNEHIINKVQINKAQINKAQINKAQEESLGIRYHYMDNLRALAMLTGVLFHAALSHSLLLSEFWPTADNHNSYIVDIICWPLHTFRMPLFFLIAGFFAHYLLEKYGLSGFVKNRAKRLVLPFIVLWPLLTAAIIGILIYAALYMPVETPILNMIQLAIENFETINSSETINNSEIMQDHQLSTTHLWFIYYLSIFCLLAVLAYKVLPTMPKVERLLSSPIFILTALPILTGLCLIKQFMPHPAPESFIPAFWAIAFFGSFFLVGWVFYKKQGLLEKMQGLWPYLFLSSFVAAAVFLRNLGPALSLEEILTIIQQGPTFTLSHTISVFACAIMAWHFTFLSLIVAYRFMNWKNAFLRYITDASYWVYIIHIPIIFYLQVWFHTQTLPIAIEFFAISFVTLAVGFISYDLLIKRTPVGWLLNGRKR